MAEKKNFLRDGNVSLCAALLTLGVLFLVFNVIGMSAGPLIWLFVGLGIFVLMVLLGKSFGWLAVPASVVTMVGVILLYSLIYNGLFPRNAGLSWIYTWTLFFAAAAMGILISHHWSGRPQETRFGTGLLKVSLVAFVGIALIVEMIHLLNTFLWPAVLIVLGGYLLLRNRNGKAQSNAKPRKVRSKAKSDEVAFEPLKTEESDKTAAAEAEGKKAKKR
jgi:hypothetical protein